MFKFLQILAASLVLSVCLSGCGCSDDDAVACANAFTAASAGGDLSASCAAVNTFIKCYKDKDCCDHDGVPEQITATKNQWNTLCTGGSAVTASC
mmetsp:Transcript_44980/g.71166  ORF Transcript_44980/g.71166 Transcript_44980/m.71166 type:complete len:95 (-) Transcript_44980:575-859(-)